MKMIRQCAAALLLLLAATTAGAQAYERPHIPEGATVCYVANDLGRNGYYEQKPVAELMGELAKDVDLEFVAAPGDVHHFEGVASTADPLWMTNYELIYAHPELMLPWYPLLGNHEYRGNTQAVLDYAGVSARWKMPARYYARRVEAGGATALLLFIDTTPLMDKYRNATDKYPDAAAQSRDEQLAWIEQQLRTSKDKWKIVLGHHPVYAYTPKDNSERADMQRYLKPLLDRYGVDFYICGHIHNFQHIKPRNSKTDYLVNSSGSLARSVQPTPDTRFCSPEAGFTVLSMAQDTVSINLMSSKGKILYTYNRVKP